MYTLGSTDESVKLPCRSSGRTKSSRCPAAASVLLFIRGLIYMRVVNDLASSESKKHGCGSSGTGGQTPTAVRMQLKGEAMRLRFAKKARCEKCASRTRDREGF